jgi:hypothetical protein
MHLVIIESPYAGRSKNPIVAFFQRMANRRYARACVRDSLLRGEAPIASHLLYTQPGILCDEVREERIMGIGAGLRWLKVADKTMVYTDRGISSGMRHGIAAATMRGLTVEYRRLNR